MSNIDIIIFDEEELTITLIESYLKELTFDCSLYKYNKFNADILNAEDTVKIVLINLNYDDDYIFEQISEFTENRNIKIIAMSYDKSANLQVKSFRAGVKDFLIKPLIKTDFVDAVQSVYKKYIFKTNTNYEANVFTAVSNKKGDGKSEFLINLAKELADISFEKVLLLDFNNSQDSISVLLNADIVHNTNYYINNLTQDNAQALLATVTKYKNSNLYIMANTFVKNKTIEIKKDKLCDALNILKQNFRYILIDRTPDENTIEDETLINISDEIFCIVLPFISSFGKIKKVLDNHYKNKNVKIILNQYSPGDDYKIDKIQSSIGREIFWKIPKNYMASNNAKNKNLTLQEAANGTDIANAYFDLAKYLVNRD